MTVRVPAGSNPGGDFYRDEFTGADVATSIQLASLRDLVDDILQPIRDRFGVVVPTSWLTWSNGTPRTGAHATGAAVDFVTPHADMAEVHRWAAGALWGRFGELGYERDHIHVTLPPVGGVNDVWVEPVEGVYERPPWFYELPGIVVGGGDGTVPWWLLAALAVLLASGANRGRG